MKRSKLYFYETEYASGILRQNRNQDTIIYSTKKLKEKDFIIVEHINCGVFIGRIIQDVSDEGYYDKSSVEYRYLKDINLNDWVEEIDRKKRKEELEKEMQSKFEELDKIQKYAYYSQFDNDFKSLYEEYKRLEDKKNN